MEFNKNINLLIGVCIAIFSISCSSTQKNTKSIENSTIVKKELKATPLIKKKKSIDSTLAATNLNEIEKYIDDLEMWTYVEQVINPYKTIDEALYQDSIQILHRVISSYINKTNVTKEDARRLNDAIQLLLQKKADVSLLNENGEDALNAFLKIKSRSSRTLSTWDKNQKHHSAQEMESIILLFIENGAKIHNKDKNGVSSFEKIVDFASIDFIKNLLETKENKIDIDSVLNVALQYNHNDLVNYALENGASINTSTEKGKRIFIKTVNDINDISLFKKIIEKTSDIHITERTKKGQTRNALHVLILGLSDQKTQKVYLDKIIYLLEKGIKVIEKDWMKAGEENSLIVLVLANSGLTYEKSERVCKMLIEQGANVNLITNLQSPLFILLYRNYRHPIESLLELFIEKGADVNFIFRETKTPLDLVTHYLSSENELLKNKAIKINNLLRAKGAKLFTELEK